MIEAAMYFALGLAVAGLMALMIAPFLWRRAVRLTRARIEHALPRNLSEIQAEKDQLRAEFAMSTRRLELSVERLREKAGEHLTEIGQKRELIRRLAEEQAKRVAALDQLEAREAELDKLLKRREERLAEASAELEATRNNLAERGRALEQLEQTLKRLNAASEQKTVELVAKGTEIDNLRDQLVAARSKQTALEIERARATATLSEAHSARAMDAQRMESLERQFARLEALRQEHAIELSERDAEISRLADELASRAAAQEEAEARLTETEAAYAEASAHLADMALQLDEVSRRHEADILGDAMVGLDAERTAIAAQLAALQEAHDRLAVENAELRRISGTEWEQERVENAMLRERLNDVAGDVARLTRSYRGELGLGELAALGATEKPDRPPRGDSGRSLTARIRARQRSA